MAMICGAKDHIITYCLYALTYKIVFSVFENDAQGQ
jgi:hypothetical protein